MSKFTITFEIANKATLLNDETKNIADSLHEALCLSIYEHDEKAINWLSDNVSDIAD